MQDKTRIVIFVFVESRENPQERGVEKKQRRSGSAEHIVRGLSVYTLTTFSVAPNFRQMKFNQSTCFTDNSVFAGPTDFIRLGIYNILSHIIRRRNNRITYT